MESPQLWSFEIGIPAVTANCAVYEQGNSDTTVMLDKHLLQRRGEKNHGNACGILPLKIQAKKKNKGGKDVAVTNQDSDFERKHAKMSTSFSSPQSSPQDRNLISGLTTGHGDVWKNSVNGFHWNVGHAFSS